MILRRFFLSPALGSTGKSRARVEPAFTLVELLVVMAIVGLLLAAVLPAMRGLSGSTGRRGGVRGLLAALDQARTQAISDGHATYLVFACPADASAATTVKPALRGRGYAIFQDTDNIDFKPAQRSAWLLLPTGVAFKTDAATDGSTASVSNRPLKQGVDPAFPLSAAALGAGSTPGQQVRLPYLKFDPTGAVDEQDAKYLRVLLFEGFLNDTGAEVATRRPASGNASGADAKALWEEIRVNPATGRARYTLDPAENLGGGNPDDPSS